MSDKDEKDNKEDDTSQINQDGVTKNPETLFEGNVLSSDLSKANNSAVTENMPHSPIEGNGDNKEVSELDLIEAELTEMSKELNMDAGEGSTAKVKVGKDAKIMDILIEMDANASKTDAKEDNDETDIDKCDDIKLKKTGDVEDIDDEDIELRWDDDDASNQLASDEKNDNILSEDQLLEDSSDVLTKDTNPKSVTVKDDNEEKKFTNDDNLKEIEAPEESATSPKLEIPTEKTDDEKSLEDELLEEPDVHTEDINSPEMIFSAEESMDRDFIKVLEDKLLDEDEVNIEKDVLVPAKDILEEKFMDKVIKETEIPTEDANDKETKDNLDIIKEAELLDESESNTEEKTASLKMTSFTDVILNEDNADGVSEENLIEKPDLKDNNSTNESENDIESDVPVKELPINKELVDDDVLLEEELLEETDAAKAVPESVTMEVDDEKEGELLKDDEVEDDSHAPMDVDVSDPSNEDVEDKIIDQPMAEQSIIEKEEIAIPTDDQTSLKKVDIDQPTAEIQGIDETDKAVLTEKIIDQPVEDATKTVETIPAEEQSETGEINKKSAIEDKSKIDEEYIDSDILEKEHENQPRTEEKKIEDQITIETDTDAQSIKNSEEIVPLPISNTEIEEPDKSTTDKSTLDKEIVIEKDPEQPELTTKSVHKDVDTEKTEKSKDIAELDTSIDKTNVTADETPTSTTFQDNVSPIKGMHGLNKPDVMLEIPSQELIDMDCTDLSLNLDGLNDSITANIKTEDDIVTDDPVDTVKGDDETVIEKSVDTTKADDDTASQNTVDQVAVVTETKAAEIATENDKTVDQQTTAAEATVDEVQTESKSEESEKKETTVVQATVEENMERMFADDEPEVAQEVPECIASTSQLDLPVEQPPTSSTQMTPDTSDEVPEVSDSLGLLAESAGRMMDDEEGEDDDDGDDDDDFDQDESSNQVSAEQSEDSNPAALESEPQTEAEDKELETPEPKEGEFPFLCNITSEDKEEKMDIEEFGTIELQAETIQGMTEEAKSAVDAILNNDNTDDAQGEDAKESAEQMDVVKLSDVSDNELDIEPTEVTKPVTEASKEGEEKQSQSPSKSPADVSPKKSPPNLSQSPSKQSPSKMKNLAITTQVASAVVNIVDLEESSSSEDDVQETAVQNKPQPEPETTDADKPSDPDSTVTTVNIPTGIDIMCTSGGNTSEITTKEGEVTISGVPKPPPHRPARLNTSEVSIKTVSSAEPMVIPETKINEQAQPSGQSKPKLSLEIFSLDSDEDDGSAKEKSAATPPHKMTALELEKARETSKCVNYSCTSDSTVQYRVAETAEVLFYDASRKRRGMICQPCADVVAGRTKNLIQGIKDMTPLLELDMDKLSQDLVEISDSESEEDYMSSEEPKETIGEEGAKVAESSLAKFLNETWQKYNMDARLKETQIMLDDEIEKLEQDSKEIDAMLNECQAATDKLRCELYATFECRRQQQPALLILDTPDNRFIGPEEPCALPPVEPISTRQAKRRLSSTNEVPAKRPAIPLGYAPLDSGDAKEKAAIPGPEIQMDDDKEDISVVKLSAEAAPPDLPPPGEISRPPLRVGMPVYAMKNAFGPWFKGRVLEIQPKNASTGNPYSFCRVRFDHKAKTNGKVLKASSVAYSDPADVRMTIGTRLIALIKDSNKRETYYAGVVAEIPNPVNSYRYLVFFDDGYAQYVQHQHTRLVCESSPLVWEEVHQFSRDFVREYLLAYPERPMVRLHKGQHLKTEWNGKWWSSRVTQVDASLAQVLFVGDGRREWIYRGSTRLAPLYLELRAAERHRPRPMPRSKAQPRSNMPYVEYTRSDEQESNKPTDAQIQTLQQIQQQQQQLQNEEIRRQRAVAKKSTSSVPSPAPPAPLPPSADPVTSRVVYYTPKNAVKPLKMVPHKCTPKCKRSDVLSLKELRTYNPLAKPLLSGWERQIVRFKGHKDVMYRAPCGRRIRNMRELHHYLRSIDSDLPVDLFDFHYSTHCLAEFVLNKCLVGKKDLSHGKENVPVPCVNYYDDSLPEFCSYNTERTPTAGVPLNLDPEFLCGCDCTDDCQDKSKCACWKMTLEGARTIGLEGPNVGYVYKRLPEPLPSGIYECNSRCKCKHTCLNRVAQHPLQLKLQVFKTPNRGWGIRALNDVPKGSFLCVYAGNLLTDATANLDGLNEGDEYLAELDYIEVVEQMKEGFEEDIPEADKKLDKKEGKEGESSESEEDSSSEGEDNASKTDKEDDDFRPGHIGLGVAEFNKRLRKREKSKKGKDKTGTDDKDKDNKDAKEANGDEDCITISDDEEVREPSRFMAQLNMGANDYISKYKSVRTLFGKDEACYIMDAKVQGNIGRYLNHSCCPNVFVQNVFVDTHDPRFPWVAFFALSHIKAGTELTWNYNYDVGSVPGKILYCYCGAVNCRGRLL